jgi:hypothetical protein
MCPALYYFLGVNFRLFPSFAAFTKVLYAAFGGICFYIFRKTACINLLAISRKALILLLTGDGVFERILLLIVKYILNIKRQKPRREERPRMSEYTLSPVGSEIFMNDMGYL